MAMDVENESLDELTMAELVLDELGSRLHRRRQRTRSQVWPAVCSVPAPAICIANERWLAAKGIAKASQASLRARFPTTTWRNIRSA
jgi:hypothetical protein